VGQFGIRRIEYLAGVSISNAFPGYDSNWATPWQQGDFPFLFVQLANYMAAKPEPGQSDWAELREAQLMTLSKPNTRNGRS